MNCWTGNACCSEVGFVLLLRKHGLLNVKYFSKFNLQRISLSCAHLNVGVRSFKGKKRDTEERTGERA
jgi:hypothetical protein